MQHIADNHDALLDYLYDEGDPAERIRIARHLQECAPCSVAVLEFQNVRGMLRDWTPPAADLGFRIVQDIDASPRASVPQRAQGGWWQGWGRATHQARWAQAAAAVLLFAAGMAASQLTVQYTDGALTVRTRPGVPSPSVQTVSARTASIPLPAEHTDGVDIDALERELRSRMTASNASPVDTEQLLQRVRAMIDQSEQRQQRELALRLSQVATEVDTQHQADLLRIQQSLGQQQDEFMNYLVRTSGGTK